MIEASCHCGAVKILMSDVKPTVTSCNCSICRRYATLWSYGNDQTVQIVAGDGDLEEYAWGTKDLAFVRCATCGCVTHWQSLWNETPRKIAVNMRLAATEVLSGLTIRHFDGAESWSYLD